MKKIIKIFVFIALFNLFLSHNAIAQRTDGFFTDTQAEYYDRDSWEQNYFATYIAINSFNDNETPLNGGLLIMTGIGLSYLALKQKDGGKND